MPIKQSEVKDRSVTDADPELTHAPETDDTAAEVVIDGEPANRIVVESVSFSYNATPSPASNPMITVKAGATIVRQLYCPSAGPGPLDVGLRFAANTDVTVTLTAGGSGVKGAVNVNARRVPA